MIQKPPLGYGPVITIATYQKQKQSDSHFQDFVQKQLILSSPIANERPSRGIICVTLRHFASLCVTLRHSASVPVTFWHFYFCFSINIFADAEEIASDELLQWLRSRRLSTKMSILDSIFDLKRFDWFQLFKRATLVPRLFSKWLFSDVQFSD